MCGICGIYHYGSGAPADRHLLEEMTHRLTHRGPDDEGFFVAGALGMGMRRLSIRGATRKYIHKKAIAAWVGQDILARPKRGFETPMDAWFRAELSTYVREALLGAGSACRLYFEDRALASLLADHVRGRYNNQRLLFSLLMFELWHRQFITADPPQQP
jgi:asparagine synthetase B (glutamine-hydrolysing)